MYHPPRADRQPRACRVAVSIHADGGPSGGRGFHVIRPTRIDGLTDDIDVASRRLGRLMRSAYEERTGLPRATYLGGSGLVARGDLGGLRLSDVPKVFVETANMRNPPTPASSSHAASASGSRAASPRACSASWRPDAFRSCSLHDHSTVRRAVALVGSRQSPSGGVPNAWTYLGRRMRRSDLAGARGAGERAVLARGADPRRAVPFLQHIGNGGYDAQHYDLTIDYDPIAHSIVSTTDITARATQGLSEFSLDFVPYYTVSSIKVNGVDATWTRDDDLPNYKMKLVVTPAAGIPNGSTFHVVIAYSGTPQNFVDSDGSLEGFMRTTPSIATTRPWAPST